jgi:hypothetical protein
MAPMTERERIAFSSKIQAEYGLQIDQDSDILAMLKMIENMKGDTLAMMEKQIDKLKEKSAENSKPPILTMKEVLYITLCVSMVAAVILISYCFFKKI